MLYDLLESRCIYIYPVCETCFGKRRQGPWRVGIGPGEWGNGGQGNGETGARAMGNWKGPGSGDAEKNNSSWLLYLTSAP